MSSENTDSPSTAKRRRLHGACDLCKLKRTRCDSAIMPDNICSNCIAHNEPCTHNIKAPKKPPKQTSLNFVNYSMGSGSDTSPGRLSESTSLDSQTLDLCITRLLSNPPMIPNSQGAIPDLLVQLAQRVRALEAELEACRQVLARDVPPETIRQPSAIVTTVDLQEDVSSVIQDTADIALTDSFKKTLTIGQSRHRYYGKSSVIMLMKNAIDLKKDLTGKPDGLVFSAKRREFWDDQPWQRALHEDDYLPPYIFPEDDLMQDLIRLYFANEGGPCVIHRPAFERKIRQGLHEYDRNFGGLLLAMCALASRYSQDPRVFLDRAQEHTAGWKWFRQIRPLPRSFVHPVSLYELQTQVLSVFYANGSTTPESSWLLPGFGIRMAQAVGAHRRRPEGFQTSVEDEEWKSAFWAVRVNDVFSAVTTGRPVAISADDYDQDFPSVCDEEYWEHPDPTQRFVQPPEQIPKSSGLREYLSLVEILAFQHRTIYAAKRSNLSSAPNGHVWDKNAIVTIDSELNKWVSNIPEHLRWNPQHPDDALFKRSMGIYSLYYFVQIQVHRPFISSIGKGPNAPAVSFPSLAICVNAARACCHVIDIYQKRGLALVPYVQIMVFYSAVILLINIWRNKSTGLVRHIEQDVANVHKCLDILKPHELRWQVAGRYSDMIRALFDDLDTVPTAHVSVPSLKRSREDTDTATESLIASQQSDMKWSSSTSTLNSTPALDGGNHSLDPRDFLPLYTDELGRPSPASSTDDGPVSRDGTEPYNYGAWFQGHFPVNTLFDGGDFSGDQWEIDAPPGRLDGGFLMSFMGDTGAQYESQDAPSFEAINQEMANWFSQTT